MTSTKRITLIMTKGISLVQWRDSGLLYRELALYESLYEKYGIKTQIISFGGNEDKEIIRAYKGLSVHCNQFNLPMDQYIHFLPWLHYNTIQKSAFIKTNQVKGAEIVDSISDVSGIPILARCGYMPSDLIKNGINFNEDLYLSTLSSESKLFALANKIIVTTDHIKNYLIQTHNISADKITVIPNFVDTNSFHPENKKGPSSRKKILFVGRLSAEKNLINLLTACTDLDVDVQFIGRGDLHNDLINLARKLNISLTITPPVPNNQLPSYYNQADIFALVSHHEGNPKTLIEAMSCGLPVLGADSPGIRNIIHHGIDGWLCATDSESIHQALTRLLNDEALCKLMAENARANTVQNNSLVKIVSKEYETYVDLFNISSSPKSIKKTIENNLKLLQVSLLVFRHRINSRGRMNMKNIIKSILSRILVLFSSPWISYAWFLDRLSIRKPEKMLAIQRYVSNKVFDKNATKSIVINQINCYLQNSSADESLKLLFELDNWMYIQEGKKSVEYNHGLHTKHRHINHYRFFADHIQEGQSVIDLGCGNGALTKQAAQKTTAQVLGIDFSENNIQKAIQDFSEENITYQLGNIYTDLPDQHYDIVIMSNVLEHLENRVEILATIKQKINPNHYLIRVPLFERDWRVPLKKELGLEYRLDLTHYIEYTQEIFEEEITQAGLMIESQETRWGEIWAVLKKRD
jgi:glycosyltransferase involved in cell wall biosynthesis/2-polyprenyl-3-methyl-5-hydroxy-6-metoxy-1,4-benzoquinol methylase